MPEAEAFVQAAWGYGLAAAAFAAFSVLLVAGWKGGLRVTALLAAIVLSALWAAFSAAYAITPSAGTGMAARVFDVLRLVAWFAFVAAVSRGGQPAGGMGRVGWLAALASVAAAGELLLPVRPGVISVDVPAWAYAAAVGAAVCGLLFAEQLYRGTPAHLKWSIKPLCIALTAMFGYDLFFHSNALLFRALDPGLWSARGVVHAMVIPLVAVATARNTAWTVDIGVSRHVVFHSTALVLSGAYLLAVSAAGYYVRYFGGTWGVALQAVVVSCALLALALVVLSGRFRSRLRVFVSKNFFSYRYDYREEWLRFTRTLSTHNPQMPLPEVCVRALADLVESASGAIWLRRGEVFQQAGRQAMPVVRDPEPAAGPLVQYLARTGWVVEVREAAARPAAYDGLVLPAWLASVPQAWLVVPLSGANELAGFVVLGDPRTPIEVDWEVRDLLKTAGQQAATYLGHMQSTDALLEAQKFAAFNRMSAFVVHDLKNLVAQLSLMLANADRHRANPAFQQDMLETVEHVVARMNGLMLQLRVGTTPIEKPGPVELEGILRRVQAAKRDAGTRMTLDIAHGVRALAHCERLEHVIGHLVQNALDATASGGAVTVRTRREGAFAVVEVADDGVGMSPEYIRDRLARPFQTTKAHGMGIGVYESDQYVRQLGGSLAVDSAPGRGTCVRVHLPAEAPARTPKALKEVA
jgi:hypothetical protein